MNILFLISVSDSVDGDSRKWVNLFQEWMQLFVIEFRPYVTLFTRGMYKHADRFSLVGIVCISPHLWKKFSNYFGNLPLRNEWHRRQFCISTRSFIFRIFQSLNNGEEGSKIRKRHNSKGFLLKLIYFCSCCLSPKLIPNLAAITKMWFKNSMVYVFKLNSWNIMSDFW